MNVSLSRSALPGDYEQVLNSKKTLKDVRELIKQKPEVEPLLRDAMQSVLCTLTRRFQAMEIKGESVNVTLPATDDAMNRHFQRLHVI